MSAEVVIDRATGRSRGSAFLLMASGGEEAIQATNASEFQGRILTVKVANWRWWNTQRPSRNTS